MESGGLSTMIRFLEDNFEPEYASALFWLLGIIYTILAWWYPDLIWVVLYWHLCGCIFFLLRKKSKTKVCSSCYGLGICLACNGAGKVVV